MLVIDHEDNPAAYYRLGLIESYKQNYQSAESFFKKALSKNNLLVDVFTALVSIYVIEKKYNTAHEMIKELLEKSKDKVVTKAVVYLLEARLFMAQKNMERAIDACNKSILANPDYLQPYLLLAKLFFDQDKKDLAIKEYKLLLEKKPELTTPHMMLGIIYDSEDNHKKASKHYEAALKINPEFAPAANNLAYFLANYIPDLDLALKYARIAKEKLPENPAVMDTLGFIYLKKGLYGNAVNEFLDCSKKVPNNPVVYYHLGLAYSKKGDKEKAIDALRTALNLNKDFKEINDAKQLLSILEE